jgi:hypothetical protein
VSLEFVVVLVVLMMLGVLVGVVLIALGVLILNVLVITAITVVTPQLLSRARVSSCLDV